MKRIIQISVWMVILFAAPKQFVAQCAPWVSTNPSEPFNQHLPDVFQQNPPTPPFIQDLKYLNGFNWWNPVEYILEPFMEFNPGEPYVFMSNIQHPFIEDYYTYLRKDLGAEELTPQNGWELLLVNLGRYPDDQTQLTQMSLSAVPYIVLYNKYRGVIRVFVQHGRNTVVPDAVDGVQIYLQYIKPPGNNGNVSGLLRLGQGVDRTLDQNSVTRTLSVVAPTNGNYNFWMSGDIQIAYDPCVCWKPSILDLRFRFFSTTDLTLHGRSYTTQEPLVNSSGTAILDLPLLANFEMHNPVLEDAANGFAIYKKMNDMVLTYIDRLEKHKEDLEKVQRQNDIVNYNLLVLKVFSIFLTSGKSVASTSFEMQQLKSTNPEVAFDFSGTATTEIVEKGKFEKFLKAVGKIMGDNSEFLGLEDFTKKKEPNAPQIPTVAFTEMYIQGKLENAKQVNGPGFPTPGSFKNDPTQYNGLTTQYGYPVYNQALGTFALLEKPKVKIAEVLKHDTRCVEHPVSSRPIATGDGLGNSPSDYFKPFEEQWSNTIQIQLDSDLKYTFNPALDIKSHEIHAWFEIQTRVVSDFPPIEEAWDPNAIRDGTIGWQREYWWPVPKNNPIHNFNAQSIIIDMSDPNEVIAMPHLFFNPFGGIDSSLLTHPVQSIRLPIDAFKTYPVSFSVRNSHSRFWSPSVNFVCQTPLFNDEGIPVLDPMGMYNIENRDVQSYINPAANTLYGNRFGHKLVIDKIILKMEVSIEFESFHSDDSPHSVVEIHSFDLTEGLSTDQIMNLGQNPPIFSDYDIEWQTVVDLSELKENIFLEGDIHFDGSPVEFFRYNSNSNTYFASALYDVNIANANLTIEPNSGIKVEIWAGREINVHPNSVLNHEIILDIKAFMDTETNPMPPVTPEYVESFCRGLLPDLPNYAANFTPRLESESDLDTVISNESYNPIEFILFPNPTTGASQAGIYLPELATVSITIIDVSGKVVGSPVQNLTLANGRNVQNLETESLQPGVYLVHLVVNGEKFVQRLVKQ
jgi:hypothetical protein